MIQPHGVNVTRHIINMVYTQSRVDIRPAKAAAIYIFLISWKWILAGTISTMPTMVQVGAGCLESDTPLSETMVDYHLIDAHAPPGLDELMVGDLHVKDIKARE